MTYRVSITLIVLAIVVAAAPAPAAADVRVFRPTRTGAQSLEFKLPGLRPAVVQHAALRIGGERRRLALPVVRRAAQRGVLRVRARRAIALEVTTCVRSSTRYAAAIAATPGLAGYWRLGERRGTAACDETRRHLAIYEGRIALRRPGATGDGDTAARFTGSSRVTVAPASAAATAGISVEAWIRPDSIRSQSIVNKDRAFALRNP